MDKKGRPKKITLDMELQIYSVLKVNPQATIKDIRKALRDYLFLKLKADSPGTEDEEINRQLDDSDSILPGESAINKYVTPRREQKVSEKDGSWSMSALTTHPHLASIAPQLLFMKEVMRASGQKMSIRWALWYYTLTNTYQTNTWEPEKYLVDILLLTTLYSEYESLWEQAGIPLPVDTSRFDSLFIERARQNFVDWFGSFLEIDAEKLKQWKSAIQTAPTKMRELFTQLSKGVETGGGSHGTR